MADALASGASGGYLMVVQIHSAAPLKSICGCGGIGRRTWLKIKRSPLRAGSSPAFGTTSKFKALRKTRKAFFVV